MTAQELEQRAAAWLERMRPRVAFVQAHMQAGDPVDSGVSDLIRYGAYTILHDGESRAERAVAAAEKVRALQAHFGGEWQDVAPDKSGDYADRYVLLVRTERVDGMRVEISADRESFPRGMR